MGTSNIIPVFSEGQQLAAAEAVRSFYAENGYIYEEFVSVLLPGINEADAYFITEDINWDGVRNGVAVRDLYASNREFNQSLVNNSPFTSRINRFLPEAGYCGLARGPFLSEVCQTVFYNDSFPLDKFEPVPTPQLIIGSSGVFSTGSVIKDWRRLCISEQTPCEPDLFGKASDSQFCKEGIKAASGCLDYIEENFKSNNWHQAYFRILSLFEKGCAIPPEISKMFEEIMVTEITLFPEFKGTAKMLSEFYFRTGRPAEAIPYIKEYIERLVQEKGWFFTQSRMLLGEAYYKMGDYQTAYDVYKKLSEEDITYRCNAYYNIARCFIKIRNYDGALEYLEKISRDIKPGMPVATWSIEHEDSYEALSEKSAKLKKDGKNKEALVYALMAVLLMPEDAALQYAVGELYEFKEKAVPYLERATALEPKKAFYWNDLGVAYSYAKSPEDEIRAFKESIKLDPKNAMAHSNLGDCYYYDEKYDKAIEEYVLAVKYAGDDSAFIERAESMLGKAYIALRNKKSAQTPIKAPKKVKKELEWY